MTGRLSSLVARARLPGAHAPLTRTFIGSGQCRSRSWPRTWRWWLATAVARFFRRRGADRVPVAGSHEVQSRSGRLTEIDELVSHDVQSYYSEHPAASFPQVWVNNSPGGYHCIAMFVVLGLPGYRWCFSITLPTSD